MGLSEIPSLQTSERCELLKRGGEERARHLMNVWEGKEEKCLERVAERKAGQRGGISFPSLPPSVSQITYLSSAPVCTVGKMPEGWIALAGYMEQREGMVMI